MKIQAFLHKTPIFVNYDDSYVNAVMLTYHTCEHLFLSFSTIRTIRCGFCGVYTLNVVLQDCLQNTHIG